MKTKSYLFAGIMAAIISNNAMATGENTVTSKSYVDAMDATKQNLITTGMLEITDKSGTTYLPTLVSYDSTDGLLGNQIGILQDGNADSINSLVPSIRTSVVPSAHIVKDTIDNMVSFKQNKIPKSGYSSVDNIEPFYSGNGTSSNDWLSATVKGTGLVTKTSTDGQIGERKIFEATDVSGYHAQGLTQNEKDIQDISIPTVGAMMSAISSGVSAAAPTGTPNTVANYDANGALGSGIATANAPSYNNGSLTNGTSIATIAAVDMREAKMTCAGWPDSVAVADRTDANCWLWQRN